MLFRSDRKSTRLNSSHTIISYAVFCLKKKNTRDRGHRGPCPRNLPSDPRAASRASAELAFSCQTPPWCEIVGAPWETRLFFFLNTGAPPEFPLFPPQPLFK